MLVSAPKVILVLSSNLQILPIKAHFPLTPTGGNYLEAKVAMVGSAMLLKGLVR